MSKSPAQRRTDKEMLEKDLADFHKERKRQDKIVRERGERDEKRPRS